MHFLRNHQENHKKSANYQQITTKSTVNYLKSATIIQYTIKGRFMSR